MFPLVLCCRLILKPRITAGITNFLVGLLNYYQLKMRIASSNMKRNIKIYILDNIIAIINQLRGTSLNNNDFFFKNLAKIKEYQHVNNLYRLFSCAIVT